MSYDLYAFLLSSYVLTKPFELFKLFVNVLNKGLEKTP